MCTLRGMETGSCWQNWMLSVMQCASVKLKTEQVGRLKSYRQKKKKNRQEGRFLSGLKSLQKHYPRHVRSIQLIHCQSPRRCANAEV